MSSNPFWEFVSPFLASGTFLHMSLFCDFLAFIPPFFANSPQAVTSFPWDLSLLHCQNVGVELAPHSTRMVGCHWLKLITVSHFPGSGVWFKSDFSLSIKRKLRYRFSSEFGGEKVWALDSYNQPPNTKRNLLTFQTSTVKRNCRGGARKHLWDPNQAKAEASPTFWTSLCFEPNPNKNYLPTSLPSFAISA